MTIEERLTLIEALAQFIDNQPDVDDPDPRDLRKAEIATILLNEQECRLLVSLTG